MMQDQVAVRHIREVAGHHLYQLLLARFLLLDLLVQEAKKLPGGLKNKEHRRLWVLLQAHPQLLDQQFQESDVFTELALLLQNLSLSDLQDRIRALRLELSPILTKVKNPATGRKGSPPLFLHSR